MIIGFKPQKGKAVDKLPYKVVYKFPTTKYLMSTKYDGNQIFIVKHQNEIRFFTSDWKEFYISTVASLLEPLHGSFILVGEYLHGCDGKLGDRRKSAKLTTYRTNFSKSLPNSLEDEAKTKIKVFDFLEIIGESVVTDLPYSKRLEGARQLLSIFKTVSVIETMLVTGEQAEALAKSLVNDGWEGAMLVEPDTIYHIGKRVNHSIKLKYRKTADLKCIGIEEGEGKYTGMIGALILEDSSGRKVSVGSGLSDRDREASISRFVGKIIEIEYEQLMDTYIQPTFICVREYKHESD
jgi:DNA ligase-1